MTNKITLNDFALIESKFNRIVADYNLKNASYNLTSKVRKNVPCASMVIFIGDKEEDGFDFYEVYWFEEGTSPLDTFNRIEERLKNIKEERIANIKADIARLEDLKSKLAEIEGEK